MQHTTDVAAGVLDVLVIDDDDDDAILLERHLRRAQERDVAFRHCGNPTEGLQALRERPPDVVFVDFLLGASTGLDVLAAVVASGFDGAVIFMTGHGDEAIAVKAFKNGADDYLVKAAISEKSLSRSLHNALEKCRLRREIRRHQLNLEQSNRDLERRNAEINAFYHTLSHELKTPLTAALAFLDLVLDEIPGPINDDQTEYLRTARESCEQMTVCINDLLDATRLETGKLVIERRPESLQDLVAHAVAASTPAAKEAQLRLTWTSAAAESPVLVDRVRIVQVLNNLIGNAVKFTPPGGCIEVTLSADESADELLVAVCDTGIGISADKLDRVFDRLYQAEPDHQAQGLGLGLNICRELLRLHDGRVWADSSPGAGSVITIALPRHDDGAGEDKP